MNCGEMTEEYDRWKLSYPEEWDHETDDLQCDWCEEFYHVSELNYDLEALDTNFKVLCNKCVDKIGD